MSLPEQPTSIIVGNTEQLTPEQYAHLTAYLGTTGLTVEPQYSYEQPRALLTPEEWAPLVPLPEDNDFAITTEDFLVATESFGYAEANRKSMSARLVKSLQPAHVTVDGKRAVSHNRLGELLVERDSMDKLAILHLSYFGPASLALTRFVHANKQAQINYYQEQMAA